ncbi:MAG: hypothetical protein EAX96_06785 [Candidatus Lokiarchaeota archaeon]|nr:hypothetical protein [Candidatus Lokiarchaeota archaeon]
MILFQSFIEFIPINLIKNQNEKDKTPIKEQPIYKNETLLESKNNLNLCYENYYPESFSLKNGTTGLLRDQNFNTTEFWNWTSSSNITVSKTTSNMTMFQHTSPENPIEILNYTSYSTDWDFSDQGTVQSGSLSDTYTKDNVAFTLSEVKSLQNYQLGVIFNFTGLNKSLINYQLNIFVKNTITEQFLIKILNHTSQNFDNLDIFNYTDYMWVNNSFDNNYVDEYSNVCILFQDNSRNEDQTIRDDLFLDYIEIKYDNVTYDFKTFNQIAMINQSFINNNEQALTYNLTIKYKVENLTNIKATSIQARVWNDVGDLGVVWETIITSSSGWVINYSEVSDYIQNIGNYNILIELNLTLNTTYESNITLLLDFVQVITEPDSYSFQYVDNNYIRTFEIRDTLDFEMNFSINSPESVYQLNFSIYSISINETFYVRLYNFSASSWVDFITLDETTWNWKNFSVKIGVLDLIDENNITMLKITDKGNLDGFNGLIEFDFIEAKRYAAPTYINNISTPEGEVMVGDYAIFIVKINDSYGNPVINASITANYTEDSYFFEDYKNGNYSISFYTELAGPGEKYIKILAERIFYNSSILIINFTVGGFPTNLTITQGALNISNTWNAYPQPYVNDTTKKIRVFYNSTTGGIRRAQIYAVPQWNNETLLSYVDIGYIEGTAYYGYYDINLDTIGLHQGETYLIYITALKLGYLSCNITLNITIQARNASISTIGYENITAYEQEITTIGASFIDSVSNSPIILKLPQYGNVTWEFENNSTINGTMQLFIWSYKADIDINTLGIQPGKYNITIRGNAIDYQIVETNIELNVLSRKDVELIFLGIPQEILSGNTLQILVKLQFKNGTVLSGEKLDLKITYITTGELIETSILTDSQGLGQFQFLFTGMDTLILIEVEFDGETSIKNSYNRVQISGITIFTLFIRFSPIWGTFLVIGVVSSLFYYFRYKKPKKERKIRIQKKLKTEFDDINNLLYVLILQKKGGILLYQYAVKPSTMNPVLAGGYLQAISTFKDEILKSKNKSQEEKWELAYENFKIYWISGQLAFFIFLSEKQLSTTTKQKIDKFIRAFEFKFKDKIKDFIGNVDEFNSSEDLIKKELELDLILPLKIDWKKFQSFEGLDKIQMTLVQLAISLEKEKNNFNIEKLLKTAIYKMGEPEFKIYEELYNLWKNNIFIPYESFESEQENASKKK